MKENIQVNKISVYIKIEILFFKTFQLQIHEKNIL